MSDSKGSASEGADSPSGYSDATSGHDVWCVVVAGGSGHRFGAAKQYLEIAGRRVIDRSVDTALEAGLRVVVVVPASDVESEQESFGTRALVVAGGSTRAGSVRAGLTEISVDARVVLIHDAARPVASVELFERVVAAVRDGASVVVPVVAVSDTIRSTDGRPIDRDMLRAVQTPQGFATDAIRSAHNSEGEATDDATLAEQAGFDVTFVHGERSNMKITESVDLVVAEALINARSPIAESARQV